MSLVGQVSAQQQSGVWGVLFSARAGCVPAMCFNWTYLVLTLSPRSQVGSQHRRFAEPSGQVQDGKWVVRGSDPTPTLRFEANGGQVPKQAAMAS